MNDTRPDPDALLKQLTADEARSRRGRLKLFFGASAGVGKTCAMLVAARTAQAHGLPLVIGIVETHGRGETEAMTQSLPRLPLREVAHRERTLQEFDLDAALAFGAEHPDALVLVDELAHSNAPGSRHPKRWQDVQELLDAGIDVWTTMNVQHLESLNDIVSGITNVRVWETVPDRVFDEADEVVVVDLPPDELIERLQQGKVYLPQQAELAARHFFRKGNLLALRELALRRTADRVDGQMQAYRLRSATAPVWPNRESLLACIGLGENGEKVVRSCARLAAQLNAPWHAVHVERVVPPGHQDGRQDHVLQVLKLAQDLGATTATLSGQDRAQTLVRYARAHNLSRLVIGRPSARRWRWPGQPALIQAIEDQADDLDVLQVALSAVPARPAPAGPPPVDTPFPWQGYVAALAICGLAGLVATPLVGVFELSNIVMLFLLAVVMVALRYGRGPAVLAAFFGVGLFDFFFVAPRFSFAVTDVQYLMTFSVMLVVALVVGQLTAGLKAQAQVATARERRVRGLYDMSRDLSAALLVEEVARIGARFLDVEFGARSALLVANEQDQLQVQHGATADVDMGVAQWAFNKGEPAGRGSDTLPASRCLVLPLKATMRLRGVLAIEPGHTNLLGTEQRRMLDTCASLLAISIERIHYIDVAQQTIVQMASERLRNSLLSAISHDLRTPLASMVGLADTLQLTRPPPTDQQQELVDAMRQSALRMSALVNNLLDMARLESGAVQLNLQWQPLEEVVGSALATCQLMLKGRPVRVDLPSELPLLHLDAVLIERVLVNVLENACKYTPPGSAIDLHADVEGPNVRLHIDDHGPGLPRGREDTIFEKFERGKKESATPGVGLGLAICRAIMQAHHGTIHGETRPADGARFTLTLPRGTPPNMVDTLPQTGAPSPD